MKNLSPTRKHALAFFLFLLGSTLHFLQASPGDAAYLHLTGAGLQVLAAGLLAVERSIFGDQLPPTGLAMKRGMARVHLLGALAIAAILGLLVAAPRTSPTPTARAVVVQSEGCAWWNGGGSQTVSSQGVGELACVGSKLIGGGVLDLGAIALACGIQAIADVAVDVEQIVAFYAAGAPEGGAVAALGQVCGAGAPPYPGAPACISVAQLQAIQGLAPQIAAAKAADAGTR